MAKWTTSKHTKIKGLKERFNDSLCLLGFLSFFLDSYQLFYY